MDGLIVFGEDFGGLPSSTQHLITKLSRERKVLWINSIGLRKPKVNKNDLFRALSKLFSSKKAPQQSNEQKHNSNIFVTNIKTIPAPKYKWERFIAKHMMLWQLKPLIKKLKLKSPILWISLPTAADLCGELNESQIIYYCGDDFGALAGVDHLTALTHEKHLVKQANLILVASKKMQTRFPKAKTHLIPHGVDFALFSTPTKRAADLPIGKPIVGFYGSLAKWLDMDFIYAVAKEKQDWNFVFVGPQIISCSRLKTLSNVYFLGKKPHSELPSYCQHWQISWLPFKNNAQIQACNPLKLLEYIATGVPIAATDFAAIKPFLAQINCVKSSQEMIDLLNQEKLWKSVDAKTVIEHSWQQRATQIEALLESV